MLEWMVGKVESHLDSKCLGKEDEKWGCFANPSCSNLGDDEET